MAEVFQEACPKPHYDDASRIGVCVCVLPVFCWTISDIHLERRTTLMRLQNAAHDISSAGESPASVGKASARSEAGVLSRLALPVACLSSSFSLGIGSRILGFIAFFWRRGSRSRSLLLPLWPPSANTATASDKTNLFTCQDPNKKTKSSKQGCSPCYEY